VREIEYDNFHLLNQNNIVFNQNYESSEEIIYELRKLYGLPRYLGETKSDVIEELKGMMSTYKDNTESVVDAIKGSRENIY
jgi:mannitol/fructose-specific phosphotransferase system IIA component (Ntr-type)